MFQGTCDLRYTRGTQPQAQLPNQFFTNQWVNDGLWQPTSFGKSAGKRQYYTDMQQHCRDNMLLYPYRFTEVEVLLHIGTAPFAHYHGILHDMMRAEKSYDCLPNFTAMDCLLYTGIGRNQYIDLMNKLRAKKKTVLVGKVSVRQLLPQQMADHFSLEPWWRLR
eukprot:gene35279-30070_t